MKYTEYWLYYFKPTNMLFAFKEIQEIKRQHPENFKETHVIEYQAYQDLEQKLAIAREFIKKVSELKPATIESAGGHEIPAYNIAIVDVTAKLAREALEKIGELK